MRLGRGDQLFNDSWPRLPPGLGQAVQLLEQVSALPAQDAGQRFRITHLNGRHRLEEEVVAVAAHPGARLTQPAVQLGPAPGGYVARWLSQLSASSATSRQP